MRTGERRKRLPNWLVGLILIVVTAVASVFAYTKTVPWADKYTVKGVFTTASNIRPDSPVRIAGVNVGVVTNIEHLGTEEAEDLNVQAGDPVPQAGVPSTASVITMELEESALPLHTDATMKLRPRLFLEGNLFVDLSPGSPNAPVAEDGYEFPLSQTAVAVQLDQVLGTLQADVRDNLQILLDEFGNALTKHGGAKGFRELYRTSPGAFRYTSVVNEALLGTEPHDLSKLIVNLDSTVDALDQGGELQDLVTNLQTVLGSFAAESDALRRGIRVLPDVLREGRPALVALNESFPQMRAFAREALPGVRSTPAMLDAATPLLVQVRGLVSRPELRGLTADLRTTIPRLAKLAKTSIPLLKEGRKLSSCMNEVIIPWSQEEIGGNSNPAAYPYSDQPTVVDGRVAKIFEEFSYGLEGIAGESRSGDANGPYIRVLASGGPTSIAIPPIPGTGSQNQGPQVGLLTSPILGGLPAIDSSAKTPYRPDVRCETQQPPDLRATVTAPPRQDQLPAPASSSPSPEFKGVASDFVEAQEAFNEAASGSSVRRSQRAFRQFSEAAGELGDELGAITGLGDAMDRVEELTSR